MPELNLQALLSAVRTQVRVNTTKKSFNARVAQRETAFRLAAEHAASLAKRHTLETALACEGMDAMRFRWLAEHTDQVHKVLWLGGADMIRREIDDLIKRETVRRLTEMRKEKV